MGSFDEDQANKGTVLGRFEGVSLSLFIYEYPLIYPPLKYLSLNIADIRDVAAMKIDAVATRGRKRDFNIISLSRNTVKNILIATNKEAEEKIGTQTIHNLLDKHPRIKLINTKGFDANMNKSLTEE